MFKNIELNNNPTCKASKFCLDFKQKLKINDKKSTISYHKYQQKHAIFIIKCFNQL